MKTERGSSEMEVLAQSNTSISCLSYKSTS